MGTNEMCAFIGRAHEFFLALKKAGFTDELIQEVINSKDNAAAERMFASLQAKPIIENVKDVPLLSDVVATFNVSANEEFIVADKINVNIGKNADVKISHINKNFQNWFGKKIENKFPGSVVYGRDVNTNLIGDSILVELGGEEKATTIVTEMYAMMAAQPNGESGNLKNDGSANGFYIPDVDGILRVVRLSWVGYGWNIKASSIQETLSFCLDGRVFSRIPRDSFIIQTC